MAVKQASWIQASSHPADTDRLILESLFRRQGVVKSTDLAVTQNGTPNMSVNVAAGAVAIDGTESTTQGFYHFVNDATLNVAIAAANATNPRIDLIVAKVQDAQYSGATNAASIVAVTGTAAASPVAPAAPANSVILAQVAVAALASSITNANITDVRTFAGPPACRVYRSAVLACSHGTDVTATFDLESFDTDAMHSAVSLTDRIVFNTAGLYLVDWQVTFAARTDYRWAYSYVMANNSGIPYLFGSGVGALTDAGWSPQSVGSHVVKVAAGDFFNVHVAQANAAGATVNTGTTSTAFGAVYLGVA